ncbi:hypothetical protein [Micromonospora sp. HK10]|uniref:hypothetical protein n=1 Tax=Micromonospora sp. HK10 TaxID=1538294 RepID=UPI0009E4D1F0|nr:hypothetical protein [Micromonospora sp. HK10]
MKAAGAKGPKRPVTRGQKVAAGFFGIALLCCCGSGIAAFTDSGSDKPAAKASPTAVQALAEPAVSASPSLVPTTSAPSPTSKPTPKPTRTSPKPTRTSPKPAPKRTTSAPRTTKPTTDSIRTGVHAGAFCSPAGALGRTSTGKLMRCKTSATDSRLRWRAA